MRRSRKRSDMVWKFSFSFCLLVLVILFG
jgi:hypothetical protein